VFYRTSRKNHPNEMSAIQRNLTTIHDDVPAPITHGTVDVVNFRRTVSEFPANTDGNDWQKKVTQRSGRRVNFKRNACPVDDASVFISFSRATLVRECVTFMSDNRTTVYKGVSSRALNLLAKFYTDGNKIINEHEWEKRNHVHAPVRVWFGVAAGSGCIIYLNWPWFTDDR